MGGPNYVLLVTSSRAQTQNSQCSCPATVDTGVRSINLTDFTLSYGTGHGRVAFHDLRNPKVPLVQLGGCGSINRDDKYEADAIKPRSYLEVGPGWLEENDVYR
jgi:hypothetical protein